MPPERQAGSAKKGMNKDVHISSLDQQAYIHALNANYESRSGDMVHLQNEESNILCSRFKEGFLVVGVQVDLTAHRVYFFLTNPDTGGSEIGYVAEVTTDTSFTDTIQQGCKCSIDVVLAEGLESLTQVETCTYTTLISDHDNCPDGTTPNKCLGFDINYPISSELKDEKCGKVLYFTDDLSGMRRLEVNNLDQYYVDVDGTCGDPDTPMCINCEKLLVDPPRGKFKIGVKGTRVGGQIKAGAYIVAGGYSSKTGDLLNDFNTFTTAFTLKDLSRDVYQQPELDNPTSNAVELEITGLDTSWEYYTLAVVQRSSVDGAQRYFKLGTYPTTRGTVVFNGTQNLEEITLEELLASRPVYTKAKFVTQANNKLFFSNLEAQPDPQLQQVVNFMGQFAKWRTYAADEDFYTSPKGNSQYVGYMRDEIVPFSIRFGTKQGYVTPNYPLISRAKLDSDVLFDSGTYPDLSAQKARIEALAYGSLDADWESDVFSVREDGSGLCNVSERVQKWQFYNTATKTASNLYLDCGFDEIETETKTISRSCVEEDSVELSCQSPNLFPLTLTGFDEDTPFVSLLDYIENNDGGALDDDWQARVDALKAAVACGTSCNTGTLFPGCSNILKLSETFSFRGLYSNHPGEQLTLTYNYKPCTSANYPRLTTPTDCVGVYTYVYNGTNTVGNNLNETCNYNDWLRKPVHSPCSGAQPAYYERGSNYIDNTTPGKAQKLSPLPLGQGVQPIHITPYFPSSGVGTGISLFTQTNSAAGLTDGSYTDLAATSASNDGSGATFDVTVSGGVVTDVQLNNPGGNYIVGETAKILGNLITGGTTPAADIDITVTQTESTASLASGFTSGTLSLANSDKEFIWPGGAGAFQEVDVNMFFDTNVHRNALWYKVENITTDKIIINISDIVAPPDSDFRDALIYSKKLRLTVYESDLTTIMSDTSSNAFPQLIDIDSADWADGVFCVDTSTLTDETLYFAIDAPIIEVDWGNPPRGVEEVTIFQNTGISSVINSGPHTLGQDSTSGAGSGVTFDITVDTTSGNVTLVEVNTPGNDYVVGDTITINVATIIAACGGSGGSDLIMVVEETENNNGKAYLTGTYNCLDIEVAQPILDSVEVDHEYQCGVSTFTYTSPTGLSNGTYTGVTQSSTSGSGTGAEFTFVVTGGEITSFTITNPGEGYAATDTITIAGTDVGGASPGDDFDLTVTRVRIFSLYGENVCEYQADCDLPVDEDIKCDPYPWEEGKFAYWESTETYPDNEHLYNSHALTIPVGNVPTSIRSEFEDTFTDGLGNLVEENTDFRCKPIRHFKFPDVFTAPIIDKDTTVGQDNKVFPIGFHLDNEVVDFFLDMAVFNNLITQEFRDSITYYELFRGDTRLAKSIVAKGLTYDMYKYTEQGTGTEEDVWFANFPYNDLSEIDLIYADEDREGFIQHPKSTGENNRFMFHSPDTSYEKPSPLPYEMYVETYMRGHSRGVFSQVQRHPEMVILGDRAYRVARGLATTEITLDLVSNVSAFLSRFVAGLTVGVGVPIAIGLYSASALSSAFASGRRKVAEWLDIFYNNATPVNFAHGYSSVGHYNTYEQAGSASSREGNITRGLGVAKYLKDGRYRINEKGEALPTVINHTQRESGVYLSFPDYEDNLKLTPRSLTGDNSRVRASQFGCNKANPTPEYTREIESPYVSLKQYIPDQYGKINDIQWVYTGYCSDPDTVNSCETAFGGDTFLTRFWLKRKFPFFNPAMIQGANRQSDLTPYNYEAVRNVGYPAYYVNYLVKEQDAGSVLGLPMTAPVASSEYNFDCLNTENQDGQTSMSLREGTKFYLWYYGIPGFIVESRINNLFRHGENDRDRSFYPAQANYENWTQETNVSIREDNFFTYNQNFSAQNTLTPYRVLPDNYDPEEWACRYDHWDRTIYSLDDTNEQDLNDAFRIFRANNMYDFGNKYGEYFGLYPLEAQKVLGLFENGAVIFNAYDTIPSEITNFQVGTGGVFENRPTDFFKTNLGYAGTQHSAFVSCQFGHFWVDAKRGRVHTVPPGGGGIDEVSSRGLKSWFRENLPFKIQKQFPDIPSDMLNNPYDGLGIVMAWDDRHHRLFVTKLDVQLKEEYRDQVTIQGLEFMRTFGEDETEIIKPYDPTYFEPCSWTAAYSPLAEAWGSFYSFTPNYYVEFQNYFSTGINHGDSKGVWNHLLGNNQTFQVFYGKLEPWTIEVPVQTNLQTKMYEDFSYRLDSRRYQSEFDYGYYKANFNEVVFYNDRETTGKMSLVEMTPDDLSLRVNYPRYQTDRVEVLASLDDYTWSMNYFFDNVRPNHSLPLWLNDPNNVGKELNPQALDYRPTIKNVIKGQYLTARLTQNQESRLKFIFEHFVTDSRMRDAY